MLTKKGVSSKDYQQEYIEASIKINNVLAESKPFPISSKLARRVSVHGKISIPQGRKTGV